MGNGDSGEVRAATVAEAKGFWRSKTVVWSIFGAISAIIAFKSGAIDAATCFEVVGGAIALIFLRDGQGKPIKWKPSQKAQEFTDK